MRLRDSRGFEGEILRAQRSAVSVADWRVSLDGVDERGDSPVGLIIENGGANGRTTNRREVDGYARSGKGH